MATSRRPSFSSALCYRNPKAALDWLERAFGFERFIVLTT
ncbi:MAG: VOC family protein, partial [Burkholderia sp.]|nr:VOC family protein [Burkholderia sp.]